LILVKGPGRRTGKIPIGVMTDRHLFGASLRCWLAALLLGWLAACGGGDGGGGGGTPPASVSGNGFAPETGPGDTQEYFPGAVGNRWTLDYTATENGLPTAGQLTVTITGTTNLLGKTATVVNQVDSAGGIGSRENYYYASAGGVTYLGTNDPEDVITPQIVPYVQLLFPAGIGTVSTLTAANLPIGFDPIAGAITLDLTQQIVNTGFEDVEVVAGSFAGALKQTTTISGTARSQTTDVTVPVTGIETRWFVPHVGLVKQTTSSTVDMETSASTVELKGYVVNGVPRALGIEFTAVGGLSPGDGFIPVPIGRPVVAADGANFMVVARRASGSSPSYTTEWLATRVRLDGTVDASTPISPATPAVSGTAERAAIAFDEDTNYLVVYEKDNGFTSRPSLVAQRISASGALIGTASEVASPGTNSPALAFDGTNYLLVYSRSDTYDGFGQLMGVLVSPVTGQATGAEFPLTAAEGYQSNPAVAFNGTNYLVVWEQAAWSPQTAGVHAARVTPAGSVLDRFAVADGPAEEPAVAFHNGHVVVAWLAVEPDNLHRNLHAMRISASGGLLDGTAANGGFTVTTGTSNILGLPTLASFDGNVLAAWSGDCGLGCGIYGARIVAPADALTLMSVSGTPGFRFTAGGPYPRLAAVTGGALLTWLQTFNASSQDAVKALPIFPFGP
jgi:hypothetical protein